MDELPLNTPPKTTRLHHKLKRSTWSHHLVILEIHARLNVTYPKSISRNPPLKCFPFIFQCHTAIDVAGIFRTSDYIKHCLDVLFVLSVLRPRADTTLQYFTPPQHNGNFFRERPARQALHHGKFGSWSPYGSRR